jgi:hypothetical protein
MATPTVFGPSLKGIAPSPGDHIGGASVDSQEATYATVETDEDEIVTWARNAAGVLHRERQTITKEMTNAVALSRGELPFWKGRANWKAGLRINKCVAAGTRVGTSRGILLIENDLIMNASIGADFIYDKIRNGQKEVVRLETSRGTVLRCTPDHQILTTDGWMRADKTIGRFVEMRAPQLAALPFFDETIGAYIDERWGRFLGYFAGDGWCVVDAGTIGIACDAKDWDVVNDVAALMSDLILSMPGAVRAKKATAPVLVRQRENYVKVTASRVSATRFLQHLGMANEHKRIPCVPEVIFRSPRNVVIQFLRGLFESDGCASKRQRQVFFHSIYEQFARDVSLLLLSLGIHSTVRRLNNNGGPKNRQAKTFIWSVVLGSEASGIFAASVGFVSKRKSDILNRKRALGRKPFVLTMEDSVVSVEPDGIAEVYDLSVSQTHQFGANGIIVHNCHSVPDRWAAMLSDSEPTVTYSANRPNGQRTADLLTSAFRGEYERKGWRRIIRNTIFASRVQKVAFLGLRPDPFSKQKNEARLNVIPGLQVFVDKNATCIDDAEVIMYEYRESYGKIVARFPDTEDHLQRKYSDARDFTETDASGEMLAPPATLNQPNGTTINNPPYAGSPNAPDDAAGTSGILVREFWTRPHKTVKVKVPMMTANGEPACIPREIKYADGTTEAMRRVITEGNVVYELPISLVDALRDLEMFGGMQILDEQDAWEVCFHHIDSLLYPDGRLLVVVDDSVKPENGDLLNPLGYMPFIEIEAHPDPMRFHGQSDVDLIQDAYEYVIRLLNQLLDASNLTGNPIWRIPNGSEISNDDITNAPGAIQREDLVMLKYGKREPAPEMPAYIMNLVRFMLEQIDDMAGLSGAAQGKQPQRAQASTETTMMNQEASSVLTRDAQHSVKDAIQRLGQQYQMLVERYYTEPILVEFKNELGQKESLPLLGSHLTDTFRVEAKPGSMTNASPSARLQTVLGLMGSGQPIVDLPMVWGLLAEIGFIDSARSLEDRIAKERKDPNLQWLVPGATPAPPKPGKKSNGKRAKSAQASGKL